MAATLPMFSLVWLRGNVGVDLPMYVQSIEFIQQNGGYSFIFEPGFELLILAISPIISNPILIAKIIATITTLLLLSSKWHTKIAYQALGLGILPYFYLDMTMNGLRYGLAFAVVLFSLNGLLAMQRLTYVSTMLAAASVQVSSFYLSGLLQILLRPSWKYFFLLLPIATGVALLGSDYFLMKAAANADLSKPGVTAGAAPLILSIILLAGCWSDKQINKNHRMGFLILFALSFVTYGLTQVSYAGLRFQQLNFFLILLLLIYASEKTNKKPSKIILSTLILIAALSSASRINNFYSEAGNGEAPFIPFKFFWSAQ